MTPKSGLESAQSSSVMTALSFCLPFCSDMFSEFNRTIKFKDKKFYKSFIKLCLLTKLRIYI